MAHRIYSQTFCVIIELPTSYDLPGVPSFAAMIVHYNSSLLFLPLLPLLLLLLPLTLLCFSEWSRVVRCRPVQPPAHP